MNDPSAGVVEDDKAIKQFESDRWNNDEVHRSNALLVVFEESLPGLTASIMGTLHHIPGDSRPGNFVPEQQELAVDPGRAPKRVLLTNPLNQFARLTIDSWPPATAPGFPAPIGAEALSMPAQYRCRLHDIY